MEISLRDVSRVRLNSFVYTLKHWRGTFSLLEKVAVGIIFILIILTSYKWALAASNSGSFVPVSGGVFIEGVVGNSLDDIDLGRLTKSGLVSVSSDGKFEPDIASSWEASPDKATYKFNIASNISSTEIVDTLSKNPTYLPDATCAAEGMKMVSCKLTGSDTNFLNALSKPLFPHGPYKLDKKTKNEIRLKRNPDYHLQKPYIEKFIVRIYPDKGSLEKAGSKGAVTGAINLDNTPSNWQQKKITLSKKHILFINSLKTYLKNTSTREKILKGEKPEEIKTLDILEINGVSNDPEYEALKAKLTASGIELKIRKSTLKEALLGDLPKRNYDILYLLVSENLSSDPYKYWNSAERSGDGQNFAELADADIDELTEQYRITEDPTKKKEVFDKIASLVEKEKVAVEYKNIEAKYAVSPKIKGLLINKSCLCEADRFDQVAKWYIKEKKQR